MISDFLRNGDPHVVVPLIAQMALPRARALFTSFVRARTRAHRADIPFLQPRTPRAPAAAPGIDQRCFSFVSDGLGARYLPIDQTSAGVSSVAEVTVSWDRDRASSVRVSSCGSPTRCSPGATRRRDDPVEPGRFERNGSQWAGDVANHPNRLPDEVRQDYCG